MSQESDLDNLTVGKVFGQSSHYFADFHKLKNVDSENEKK